MYLCIFCIRLVGGVPRSFFNEKSLIWLKMVESTVLNPKCEHENKQFYYLAVQYAFELAGQMKA